MGCADCRAPPRERAARARRRGGVRELRSCGNRARRTAATTFARGCIASRRCRHAPHGTHGTQHGSQAFAAAGMPGIQQIEHETRQMIEMQRAIGFQNQLLAAAEMLNSFRMKLLDMIKKAVSS
ncbi:hypothetical protein WK53_06025 [Burkholderia ubonensis]|uniref:Uncharacterized protein n=1 Tax=Burkholderia ubonensis TaxID=101571 RepID=A0AAW3ND59_9BURK|nr:hypothetical protein WK53_06025 [Burkholderia ubonensis]